MMVVDGQITPEEYDLCVEFARKVSLEPPDVDEIIEEYRQLCQTAATGRDNGRQH